MTRAIAVTIGGQTFLKKGDLRSFMQQLIARYRNGDYVNTEDFVFCLALFENHSEYPQKLAPGVLRIQVLEQEYKTRGFQIHKVDGTSDNISWTDCVRNVK